MPWKNGQGVTEQIDIHPEHAGLDDFMTRVSIAHVERGGPFSSFPSYDRILVIADGAGMTLDGGGEQIVLRPFQPFRFSGDDAIVATLPEGPILDFNVITHRSVSAALRVIAVDREMELPMGLVFCARGAFACEATRVERFDTMIGSATRVTPLADATLVFHLQTQSASASKSAMILS
jgi:environmental stress-induced protein Ves